MQTDQLNRFYFTAHALDRLRETQLELKTALWILYNRALVVVPPRDLRHNNSRKYTDRAIFYQDGPVIFTVIKTRQGQKTVGTVVTVTDQRVTLKAQGICF